MAQPKIETVLKTAPAKRSIGLKDVKDHLRLMEGYTDEDDYLNTLIKASEKRIENYIGRKLITQTWYAYAQDWPSTEDNLDLPFGKLQSVTSITYKGSTGGNNTFSSSKYIVESKSDIGRVTLTYGEDWPSDVLYPTLPITVEYVTGYGSASSDIPSEILDAQKLLISHMYENREIMSEKPLSRIPYSFKNILAEYKLEGF